MVGAAANNETTAIATQRLMTDIAWLLFSLVAVAQSGTSSAPRFLSRRSRAGRFRSARALARSPASLEARLCLAATVWKCGGVAGTEWEAEEVRSPAPGLSTRDWPAAYPMTDARRIGALESALDRLDLQPAA
jgi:hypothetical protein